MSSTARTRIRALRWRGRRFRGDAGGGARPRRDGRLLAATARRGCCSAADRSRRALLRLSRLPPGGAGLAVTQSRGRRARSPAPGPARRRRGRLALAGRHRGGPGRGHPPPACRPGRPGARGPSAAARRARARPDRLEAGGDGRRGMADHRPGQVLKYLLCERGRVVRSRSCSRCSGRTRAARARATSARRSTRSATGSSPTGPRPPSGYVVARRGGYELAPGRVAIDADDFEARGRTGLEALQRGDTARADAELASAARRTGQLPRRRALRGVGAGRARAPPRPRRPGPPWARLTERRRATTTPRRSTCRRSSSSSRSTSRRSATSRDHAPPGTPLGGPATLRARAAALQAHVRHRAQLHLAILT